ncbi:MotE family protein [Ruegeria sp.]|uniref:MotE family protein n=1 Tax=Ruegeria sp. TaxID=1879320 RepID=UPI003AFF9547
MKRSGTQKGRARPRGGVLAVIALLMIGSAAIRLGLEAGPALAKTVEPTKAEKPPMSKLAPDLQVLLTELLRREKRLKQREEALEEQEKAVEIARAAIETRLAALQQAEEDLRETLALANKAAETDLTRLTDVYQNMKPKDAAALFETMDPSFAAGFLSRMPADAAAGVLAGLSPEAAYTISVVMAGRNANAPQE